MLQRRLRPLIGCAMAVLTLSACGAPTHGAAQKTHTKGHHSTHTAIAAGTPVDVDGYTTYLPADVLADTPGIVAALTPYGLVWSSYAASIDVGGTLTMPHPYTVELSPSPGSGPLSRGARPLAALPNRVGGQSADLHFVGASGPYIGFTLDVAGTATTLAAGMLDLATGKVRMAPQGLATDASVIVGGERMGILAPTATYVFDPKSGQVTGYPADDASYLWVDLAYGEAVGTQTVPDPPQPGVAAYPAGNSVIYAPPRWQESSRQLGGDFTIWRVVNPADPSALVEVETAPCIGCSVVSLTAGALPAPKVILPDGAGSPQVAERWLSDYAIAYHGSVKGYRYPVFGLAIAPRPGQSGFAEIVVSLPAAEFRLAQAILASYPLPR